jgi:predicted peptidase
MNRYTTLSLAASLALAVLFASPPVAAQSPAPLETGFINGQVTANGITMLYVVYVPEDYSPEKQWPVIMFLAGSGHGGNDGYSPVTDTLGVQLWRHPQMFPCLVMFPQPSGDGWSGRNEDLALQALEEVVQQYHGDRNRLYLTGLSAGGDATWRLASNHPELFAAAMPVAGCGSAGKAALALKSMPIWVFHGDRDPLEGVSCARAMVAALQAAGNANIHYTEYPGIGHDAWDFAYRDPKVMEWLLAQKR